MKPVACLVLAALVAAPLAAQDQGITSETHRKHLGKIVWSKQRIRMDAQDQTPKVSSFQWGDPIYGRAYFPKSIVALGQEKNCPNPSAEFRIKAIVDGADKGWIHRHYLGSQAWTTVQVVLQLAPGDPRDDMNGGVPEKWAELVEAMAPGTHQVRIEWYGQVGDRSCGLKLAEGEFTFTKTAQPVQAAVAGQKLPPAQMRNGALEASMIQAVKDRGWKNEVPVKVVIIERDWRMVRNWRGTITHREINTHVALKKHADGSYRGTDISFRQEARPGGKWGPTEVYGIGLKNYPVDPKDVQ